MIPDLQDKVINAAKKLQQLSASADQPVAAQLLLAATSAAQPAHRSADPEQPNAPVSDQDSSELHESSAARPASELNAYAEPRRLQDCSARLNTIPAQGITPSQPLLRLHSALGHLAKTPLTPAARRGSTTA